LFILNLSKNSYSCLPSFPKADAKVRDFIVTTKKIELFFKNFFVSSMLFKSSCQF